MWKGCKSYMKVKSDIIKEINKYLKSMMILKSQKIGL